MKYDVVVVGAGPAGATTAKFLAEKGIKVLLLDKQTFPRDKPCGGGLTFKAFTRFPYLKDLIPSYSYAGYVYAPSLHHRAEMEKSEPIIGMIQRELFDAELVRLAVDQGAMFRGGNQVTDVAIGKNDVTITMNDHDVVTSEIVVGADGPWSIVAQKSGLRRSHLTIGTCLFQEFPVDAQTMDRFFGAQRRVYLFPQFQGIGGYGWIFPKKEHINVGLGRWFQQRTPDSPGNVSLQQLYTTYITTLQKHKLLPDTIPMGKLKGGSLPLRYLEKTYADRVLLCGDAAGFVNPVSGEGIYYAMASGEIAAKTIIEALEADDIHASFLVRYETRWKNDFGHDIDLLNRSAPLVRGDANKWVRLVALDASLAEIALGMMLGSLDINRNKWKLVWRYLCASLKDRFHRTATN